MTQTETSASTPNIRVLWWSDSDTLSRVIQQVTASPYNHVAVEMGGSVYEAVGGGVRATNGDAATAYAATAAAHLDLAAQPDDLARGIAWAQSQVGHAYSDLELAADALRLEVAEPGTWVCSSYAAEILVRAGVLNDVDERAETPGSLWTELEGRG